MRVLRFFILTISFILLFSFNVWAKECSRCFIGDSFTEGLEMYNTQLGDSSFYGIRGISTSGVLKKGVIEKALTNKEYDSVYILLGVNEVNNNDSEGFISRYREILDKIEELQPEAKVYVQSIVHTTLQKSKSSNFKNEYIDSYNNELIKLCEEYNIDYINLNPLFDNSVGAMYNCYSKDGLHLKPKYYCRWEKEILDN